MARTEMSASTYAVAYTRSVVGQYIEIQVKLHSLIVEVVVGLFGNMDHWIFR